MDNVLLSKEEVLLNSLKDFYSDINNINIVLPIVTGKSIISLRILDFFVTNYAKNNNIKINNNLLNYNVYQDYKNKLKSYNKRFFDPFCRINKKNITNKIAFKYDNYNIIITTIGQLNFFRWILKNNILEYIIKEIDIINLDMSLFTKNKNKNIKKNKEILSNNSLCKNRLDNRLVKF